MKWNQERSILLSKVCVSFFAALLAFTDVCCRHLVGYLMDLSPVLGGLRDGVALMAVVYACSVPGWITLASLWQLLTRLGRGEVFTSFNVRAMRRTAWCCFAVAAVCLAGTWVYRPLLVISAAAGFMGLIVRIVKNCFQLAAEMKDELDYTV